MRKVLMLFLTLLLCYAISVQAEYTEDFDSFTPLGQLQAQGSPINWEANALVDVVTSGAGQALQTTAYDDKTCRHDATGVDFGLAMDKDGIEYGFEFNEAVTSALSFRMYLRKQRLAVYSPSFGLAGGNFAIRAAGESGDTIEGNSLTSLGSQGLWEKGDWVRVSIILSGTAFDTASVVAYNITKGVDMPTGLNGISLGVNPKWHAGWTGFNFRGGSPNTMFDNAYVKDYVAPTANSYIEDFEALSLGSIDQTGWRDNAPAVTVVTTASSGEYIGGQAMKSGSSSDEWPQYALDRSENFGLQVGLFDGVEMGFDFREDDTSLASCRMYFRQGALANYSPSFGLNVGAFAIRPAGESGTVLTGNTLGAASTAGLWAKGDWVSLRLVLRGANYSSASLYAYNLTTGVEIPTGLVNVNVGTDFQSIADAWDRFNFRMSNSGGTYVDNGYIADYVNTSIVAEAPSPADGEYPVATDNLVLSWVSSVSVDSHKVYFGTSPDPNDLVFQDEVTETSYALPFNLDSSTTYYWRIDEVVDGVDNEGFVWSFTTQLGALNYPRRMAYEGFDYVSGVDLKSSGNGFGGFGWVTGWEREAGPYCYTNVGIGSLAPGMDFPYGTVGNKIQDNNDAPGGSTQNDAMRQLEYPIDLRADQDYYISYLAMGDSDSFNSCIMALRETKNVKVFDVRMLYTGYPNVTTPKFYIDPFSGTGIWPSFPVADWSSGVVNLVVVKIDANITGDDVVSVSVFNASNPMPIEEPTTWQGTMSGESNAVINWVQFDGRADAFDQWHADEVHVGTGWGAVTGNVEACGDLGTILAYDFNEDCQVTLSDVAPIASDWLRCTDPAGDNCEWVINPEDPNFSSLFTNLPESSLRVYETNSSITVDGDLSEWDGVRWYKARISSGFQTPNAADITEAKLALLWDPLSPQVVYAALKVTDTEQNFSDTPAAWNDADNIELRFSVNDTSTATAWLDSELFDTAQYYQPYHKASGGTWCTLGPISILSTDDPATDDIDVAYGSSVDGDEILYEIAMPTYSSFDLNSGTGTKVTLSDGEVIAFNLQMNSVSSLGAGGLFPDQSHVPNDWYKFTVTANSSLSLGDLGFFEADLDQDGEVGPTDLETVIEKWLSCTDPEIPGCDQPWAP